MSAGQTRQTPPSWQAHPPGQTPLGRQTPPGRVPWADTPPGRPPERRLDATLKEYEWKLNFKSDYSPIANQSSKPIIATQ